jgi:hypothetical protein
VFVVGDWVGTRGQLLDASIASAEEAAGQIADQRTARRAPIARVARVA